MNIDARAQSVLDRIDVDELVKVTLDPGNIDSPTGRVTGLKLYALAALDLCSQDRS